MLLMTYYLIVIDIINHIHPIGIGLILARMVE